MFSRIIARIGQLSGLPGLLSSFPGSDTYVLKVAVRQGNSHSLNADKPHYVKLSTPSSAVSDSAPRIPGLR